ncbi:MAG: hypothetical protein ACI9OI_002485, partial [Chitinophagales bacterium]
RIEAPTFDPSRLASVFYDRLDDDLPLPESADEVETLRVGERRYYDASCLSPLLVKCCLVTAILPQNQWTWALQNFSIF